MNKSVLTILMTAAFAVPAATTCAAAWGGNAYVSHADIYRVLSMGDEAANPGHAPEMKRGSEQKKVLNRTRQQKERIKVASRT